MQCREVQSLRPSADSGLATRDFNTEDQRSSGHKGPTLPAEDFAETSYQ